MGIDIDTDIDLYGNHDRMIIWSSYKKLAWVRFEPTTIEFHSDALIDWAIRPRAQPVWYYQHQLLWWQYISPERVGI